VRCHLQPENLGVWANGEVTDAELAKHQYTPAATGSVQVESSVLTCESPVRPGEMLAEVQFSYVGSQPTFRSCVTGAA
ncbi:hypothetical protein HAX54_011376, partial [Datura stramonium]|nr:hypothetical protein [Datura stramonium]